jgi:hypothetical protein
MLGRIGSDRFRHFFSTLQTLPPNPTTICHSVTGPRSFPPRIASDIEMYISGYRKQYKGTQEGWKGGGWPV